MAAGSIVKPRMAIGPPQVGQVETSTSQTPRSCSCWRPLAHRRKEETRAVKYGEDALPLVSVSANVDYIDMHPIQ
jgi:hypothetical protein